MGWVFGLGMRLPDPLGISMSSLDGEVTERRMTRDLMPDNFGKMLPRVSTL